jgi:hypothetical protein
MKKVYMEGTVSIDNKDRNFIVKTFKDKDVEVNIGDDYSLTLSEGKKGFHNFSIDSTIIRMSNDKYDEEKITRLIHENGNHKVKYKSSYDHSLEEIFVNEGTLNLDTQYKGKQKTNIFMKYGTNLVLEGEDLLPVKEVHKESKGMLQFNYKDKIISIDGKFEINNLDNFLKMTDWIKDVFLQTTYEGHTKTSTLKAIKKNLEDFSDLTEALLFPNTASVHSIISKVDSILATRPLNSPLEDTIMDHYSPQASAQASALNNTISTDILGNIFAYDTME